MRTRALSLFFILVFALSACGGGSAFEQNKARWENQAPDHYRFTLIVACFCPFAGAEVTYEVQGGQVLQESVQLASGRPGDEAQVSEFYRPYNTIEKVFGYVGNALKEADKTTIEYDAAYGFPTSVAVDWIELAADDEFYLTIKNFEALP